MLDPVQAAPAVLVLTGCYSTSQVDSIDPDTGQPVTTTVTEESPTGAALWGLGESIAAIVGTFVPTAAVGLAALRIARRKALETRNELEAVVTAVAAGGGPANPEAARVAMVEGMAEGTMPKGLRATVREIKNGAG